MTKLSAYFEPKFFRGSYTTDDILKLLYEQRSAKKPNYIPMGRLRGVGVSVDKMRKSDKPEFADKEPTDLIVGTFEGVCYETGELKEAAGAILPVYFRKLVMGQIAKSGEEAVFDVEIGVELTGRSIPWAWVVVNLLASDPDTKFGRLRASQGPMTVPKLTHVK